MMHSLHWELQIGFRFSIVAKRFGIIVKEGKEIKTIYRLFCQKPTFKHIDKVGLLADLPLACSFVLCKNSG